MSFLRGDRQNPPQAPYSRVPDSYTPPPRQGYPAQAYNDPNAGLFEKRSYDRRPPPSRSGMVYKVVASPSDILALSNCLIVNPSDFQQGQHVLVKGAFPLTTRHDNTGEVRPGVIGASAMQRQWIGLSIAGDEVSIEPLPLPPPYLESLDLEVSFLRKGPEVSEVFRAEEMAKNFVKAFNNVVFAIDELLAFEFHGQKLKAVVKALGVLELADEQKRGGGPRSQMKHQTNFGVLMDKTDINFIKAGDSPIKIKTSSKKAPSNAILAPNFRFQDMGIGGLDSEFSQIFRRAFSSRVFPPALVEKLGIEHVKGILLYGPPGTGKTLIARQIGKMLNAREPKIVNGPEILSKYVGASEENIRKLFADAEKEYKEKQDESGLHIIIFDELDAIFKQRGSKNDGTGVGDSVVNQLLSKMDGVDQLNNILIIGMTNRIDMIDEALLRPGRLEVHMEISLPDEAGRVQILNIHTSKMRTNGVMDHDVDLGEIAAATKNFSGAEILGLIKSATSFAFNRHVKVGTMAGISDDVENLRVNRDDFIHALDEIHPAFGVSEEELQQVIQNGIIHFHEPVNDLLRKGELFVEQVRTSTRTHLVSILLHGPPGSGKTALAASIAQASQYPFIKLVTPDNMVGLSDIQKVAAIQKIFSDSYKSPLSVVVVDNIERLIEWTSIGPRFSNAVLQTLLVLFARRPPKDRRLLVLATSSLPRNLRDSIGLSGVFDADMHVPAISDLRAVEAVLREVKLFNSNERRAAIEELDSAIFPATARDDDDPWHIGIKKLLGLIEMSRQEPENAFTRFISAVLEVRPQK